MRIALGSIEVEDAHRRGIAAFYGIPGKADRDTCRQFILHNGTNAFMDLADPEDDDE